MLGKNYPYSIIYSLLVLSTFFSCSEESRYVRLIGKDLIIPCSLPDTVEYCFVHIIRNQDCTRCSVGTLYQWNETISMVGSENISFLFIVETRLEDTDEAIEDALLRRPFQQPLFIDFSHTLQKDNPWINRNVYRDINGFLIDKSYKIVSIGNPMIDYHYLKELRSLNY